MPLLDLPLELLALIAQYVELRKSVAYLLVAKRWYQATLPVYLSQLPLSDLYLASQHDLERLPPPGSALGRLIQANTHRLSVRLVGHPCKFPTTAPWHDGIEIRFGHDGMKKWKYWICHWNNLRILDRDPRRFETEPQTLDRWSRLINKKLVELATVLQECVHLGEFTLEATRESDDMRFSLRDYLHDSTIRSLILSLPSCLNNLTLDACSSNFVSPNGSRDAIHLCPLIGERLHDFQNVRLRLRCICPQIFQAPPSKSSAESRLKSLVVRLSLPDLYGAVRQNSSRSYEQFDARSCGLSPLPLYQKDPSATPLYKSMIAAGAAFAKRIDGILMLRVSCREPNGERLFVADCVTEQFVFEGSDEFSRLNNGRRWYGWETNTEISDKLEYVRGLHEMFHQRHAHIHETSPTLYFPDENSEVYSASRAFKNALRTSKNICISSISVISRKLSGKTYT